MSDDDFEAGDSLEGFGDDSARTIRNFSCAEARFGAECLLGLPIEKREAKMAELFGDDPQILLPVFEVLRDRWESSPASVRDDAEYFYRFLLEKVSPCAEPQYKTGKFLFDERDYFLAEAALIAGTACRNLSRREEAWRWFNRSEVWFLSTARWLLSIGRLPLDLARLSYQRLALLTEERRFDEVRELLPQVTEVLERFEGREEALKCRFLEGGILIETRELEKAKEVYFEIASRAKALEKGEKLFATAQYNLVQLHAELGETEAALVASREAIPVLRRLDNRIGVGKLQCGLGLLYRKQGNRAAAIETFRAAQMEFEDLEMRADVAALHLIIADLLLEAGQEPQARWEIQAALPIIDEYKLVPEGMAALSLLHQSLKSHRINQQALRDLHGYFGNQN